MTGKCGAPSTRQAQAAIDLKTAVEKGVVDQTFPAGSGPWFFEIHAHHQAQGIFGPGADGEQSATVSERRFRIMDRTGSDHDNQPVITKRENLLDFMTRCGDLPGGVFTERDFTDDLRGRVDRPDIGDAEVVGASYHWSMSVF